VASSQALKIFRQKKNSSHVMPKSKAGARIRAEVIRLISLVPGGKFTTYGSIAVHMNVAALHVASVLSNLTEEESAALPWHRITASDGRISTAMPAATARKQRSRLRAEGMKVNKEGFIQNPDDHYHFPGPRRDIRWSAL
jgi:methylated-DNA-protein-cysteine methyltransferase-like protein